jgi:phosphoribosylaminoimidazole carboxylase (NCAIR synthetase)
MHVLFLAPDTHPYNHGFVRALKSLGVKVVAVGAQPEEQLRPAVRAQLDAYRQVAGHQHEALLVAARALADRPFDRIETIDEPLVEPAARLREALGVPGLSVSTARLCRDKVAMKDFLRQHGIPCAQSAAVDGEAALRAFVERVGYPVIVKPISGYGALDTWRLATANDLDRLLDREPFRGGRRLAAEEFIDGHEGFFDTIVGAAGIHHDFAAHYYPGCLDANQHRWISPQIAVTNRIEQDGYRELRQVGHRVVELLGLRQAATHMEWFFGHKGLKFSELGARPAGEKIWDMYRVGNDFDVYREWALALLGKPVEQKPSRRLAVGSVQIRPDRDGRITGHEGVEQAFARCGKWIYEHELPKPGTPTKGLERGWLCNTWFRLSHPDYDELRRLMTFLGETVKTFAR